MINENAYTNTRNQIQIKGGLLNMDIILDLIFTLTPFHVLIPTRRTAAECPSLCAQPPASSHWWCLATDIRNTSAGRTFLGK